MAEPIVGLSQGLIDIQIEAALVSGPSALGTSAQASRASTSSLPEIAAALPLLRKEYDRDRLCPPTAVARKDKGKGRALPRECTISPTDMTQYTRAKAPKTKVSTARFFLFVSAN